MKASFTHSLILLLMTWMVMKVYKLTTRKCVASRAYSNVFRKRKISNDRMRILLHLLKWWRNTGRSSFLYCLKMSRFIELWRRNYSHFQTHFGMLVRCSNRTWRVLTRKTFFWTAKTSLSSCSISSSFGNRIRLAKRMSSLS